MKPVDQVLDEMEHDALVELVNIGVSRAAAGLREMVGEQVHLSVPRLEIMARVEAARVIAAREPSRLVAVHQQFEGDFNGRALLIFPETKSLELVRAVTGGELPLEDIIDLEQEALAETGNVILNACLGTIANLLSRTLRLSLPDVVRGDSAELMAMGPDANPEVVMMLYIDFAILSRDLKGYIVFLMDMPGLLALKALLGDFVEKMIGEPARG